MYNVMILQYTGCNLWDDERYDFKRFPDDPSFKSDEYTKYYRPFVLRLIYE